MMKIIEGIYGLSQPTEKERPYLDEETLRIWVKKMIL